MTYAIIVLIFLGGIIFLVFHKSKLPPLPGEYQVSKTPFHMVDPSRIEEFSDNPQQNRELMVVVYYPVDQSIMTNKPIYMDKDLRVGLSGLLNLPGFLFDRISSRCGSNLPVSIKAEKYPVLLFSPGLGSHAIFYSSLLENIASHGYIIACISHPYSDHCVVFPDGRVIKRGTGDYSDEDEKEKAKILDTWSKDTIFVLDRFIELARGNHAIVSHMDLAQTGVFGHSFGGAAAAKVLLDDKRVKAGMDMDGSFYGDIHDKGFEQPFMMFISQQTGGIFFLVHHHVRKVLEKSTESYLCLLDKSVHYSFATDLAFILKRYRFLLNKMGFELWKVSPEKTLSNISSLVLCFFDKYLKGKSTDDLEMNDLVQKDEVFIQKIPESVKQ